MKTVKTVFAYEHVLCDSCGEPTCGHVAHYGDEDHVICQNCLARSPGRVAEIAREFSDVHGLADEIASTSIAKWRQLATMTDLPF